MFWKYLDPLFAPFRKAQSQVQQAKSVQGSVKIDAKRASALAKNSQDKAKALQGQAQGAAAQAQGAAGGAQAAMQNAGGAAGAAGPMVPGGINPNPPIRTTGFWIWKKKTCDQCQQGLDKTWDACPYCAEAAAQAAAANAPKAPMKTQAFMIGTGAPGGATMQLCGWIVPLQGSQRGELFTLSPASSIGTDAACTVVLHDKFMSSKHAEIKAEGGVWILKDLGSTNGTYVNDKRVDKHELVDNDFIKFGGSLVKFKSL
jgi:hypothetical protein